MNSFGNNLPGTTASTLLLVGLAIFAIVYDKMWKKLPFDHLAVYQEPIAEENRGDMQEALGCSDNSDPSSNVHVAE